MFSDMAECVYVALFDSYLSHWLPLSSHIAAGVGSQPMIFSEHGLPRLACSL